MTQSLQLKHFTFSELFEPEGLARLDAEFLSYLLEKNADLHISLLQYREQPQVVNVTDAVSEMLIAVGIHLGDFLADLFNIENEAAIAQAQTTRYNPVSAFKKYYVLRRAKKEVSRLANLPAFAELDAWLAQALSQAAIQSEDRELAVALLGTHYLAEPQQHEAEIERLVQWCTHCLATPAAQQYVTSWVSFQIPARTDFQQLVKTSATTVDSQIALTCPTENLRQRDGFDLTDPRMSAKAAQDEVNYCIYCHDHDGDFCSKGFPVKKGEPELGFKKNPLDLTLTGCPLEEKISEMHILKRDGHTLAALAMIMVDNPMCPATGHRICNDCMKACIYQKQEPVNIPQTETRILTDVLALPWGVEIYDLLTRWNPLRQRQWVMKPYNGLKVMIAGMGPAGFTLAHHLLLEGFAVVGFDGLKIEPLPQQLIETPIRNYADLVEPLSSRMMAGFGGVAEYGITVRWDKNFLKLIYLSLMRRKHFQVFGGVRFGGTLTIENAWEMGFDHFVVAVGAGLPKALSIPNSLAPGMRQANDFLMALQLGNAAKAESLTSLQIRLPAVVIGGGLTGVDTATELQAYYIAQVEKILQRCDALEKHGRLDALLQNLSPAAHKVLQEYLAHGKAVRTERERATAANEPPNFITLIQQWGGVAIAYRRSMQDSPAYINNHEEIQKALEEGIYYLECMDPTAVELDHHGLVNALLCHKRILNEANEWVVSDEEVRLPAKSIMVATGTQPNTAYEFEHRGTFNRIKLQYQHYEDIDGELKLAPGVKHVKDPEFGAFTSYHLHDKRVSLIGDTHPVFHGNVVKAIASGMRTYPKILNVLQNKLSQQGDAEEYASFRMLMQNMFTATIRENTPVTSTVRKLVIHAPLACKRYQAGQFYRLQNFETYAEKRSGASLQMEPLAITAAACDHARQELTFYISMNTTNAKLTQFLSVNEQVSLMGPAGVRAKVPDDGETILLIAEAAGLPFVLSYAQAAKAAGNKILFIGLFNRTDEIYAQQEIAASIDAGIWMIDQGAIPKAINHCDYLQGNDFIQALTHFDAIAQKPFAIADIDRVFVLGGTTLLKQVQQARQHVLSEMLVKDPLFVGSVYGNMQCMLKGVCAQCLQWQIDPESGKRTKAVFACSWQDQPLEIIDLEHLEERNKQSYVMEPLNQAWLEYIAG